MGNVINFRADRSVDEPLIVIEACGTVGPFKISVARGRRRPGLDPIVIVVDGGRTGRRIVGRFEDTETGREQPALLADVVFESLALAKDEWRPLPPRVE